MTKQERIRVDIWTSLKPLIEAEIKRTGLTANELVNMSLCDYFGLSPSGKKKPVESEVIQPSSVEKACDDEDYI